LDHQADDLTCIGRCVSASMIDAPATLAAALLIARLNRT
jgi:hypothetical protein